MSPKLALAVAAIVILWLLRRETLRVRTVSRAVWIPWFWLIILCSRPISLWFGGGGTYSVEDGSPVDRFVFLILILAGCAVLIRRRLDWGTVLSRNKWVCVYFLYLGISVLWSDYSFIAFKRWVKDLGNVVMALVVLSEMDPVEAVRTVLVRAALTLIPLSVVFIKYFPDIGRYYNRWTWTYCYGGVTTNKNELGATLLIFGFALCWSWWTCLNREAGSSRRRDLWLYALLVGLVGWLFHKADSATSLACLIIGLGIFFLLKSKPIQRRLEQVGTGSLALLVICFLVLLQAGALKAVIGALGRDTTLTGRTDIWERLLKTGTNPLIGVGYYSFWLNTERVEQASQGLYFHLNESHNGYLETYLNLGQVGLVLLIAMLIASGGSALKEAKRGDDLGVIRFSLLVVGAIYNSTEAAFCGASAIWFVLLLCALQYKRPLPQTEELEQGNSPAFAT